MRPERVALIGVFVLLGLMLGSFANVVIHRVPKAMSVVRPGSACPECGAQIRAWDNVPVLSWVLLRGRCRSCRTPITVRYPLVELGIAAAFATMAWRFTRIDEAAFAALGSWVLIVLAVIDLDTRRVPTVIVNPATAAALVWVGAMGAVRHDLGSAAAAVVSSAGSFGLLFAIAFVQPKGMGFGDVRLARFIGLLTGWFGWQWAVVALMGGFVFGGLAGIVLLAAGRSRKTALPFAPMLCAGALVALLAGDTVARWWLG